jgi:DNA-binding response OmpR family regulator
MKDNTQIRGKRILVVEDEFLVAQVVIDFLEESGAIVVGPFGRVGDALAFLNGETGSLDAAVLDVNLHGEKSYPIADLLLARKVKVIFTTGYSADKLDSLYLNFPRCQKPFNKEELISALCMTL